MRTIPIAKATPEELALGKVIGAHIYLDRSSVAKGNPAQSSKKFVGLFGTIRQRTPAEVAALTAPCRTCDKLVAGRCTSLKGCGCNRKPESWALLSSHHCPEKRW